MSTEPFISPNIYCGDRQVNCLICDEVVINIPLHDEKHTYMDIHLKVFSSDTPFGVIHDRCRVVFGANIKRNEKKYNNVIEDDTLDNFDSQGISNSPYLVTHSKVIKPLNKRHCFICDEIRHVNDNPYNKGGLGRCSAENASTR